LLLTVTITADKLLMVQH